MAGTIVSAIRGAAGAALALLLCACGSGDSSGVVEGLVGVDGGAIAYDRQGSGETVVLVHGGFVDRRMWDPQIAPLAGRFHVVRYDLRGFGGSSPAAAPYAPEDDLAALADVVASGPMHVVGLSMGSQVALRFAQAHPQRVASLVVAAGGDPRFDYPEEDIASLVGLFTTGQTKGADAAVAQWLDHPMLAPTMANTRSAGAMRTMAHENRAVFAGPVPGFTPWTAAGDEPLLPPTMPVLVVAAGADTSANRAAARALAGRLPQARYEEIAGAGHMVNMEAPEAFNRLLLDFWGVER